MESMLGVRGRPAGMPYQVDIYLNVCLNLMITISSLGERRFQQMLQRLANGIPFRVTVSPPSLIVQAGKRGAI